MPGIVGLLTKMPANQAEAELDRMLKAAHHEPFYESGTWTDESLGVYVGWTALKGSLSEKMPLYNERGDVVLAFSGEEYPEPGLVQHLKDRGHSLDASVSSYLVHVSEDDPGFPVSLNGIFHGLLADRMRGIATLFNDRYGMHRLYFHSSDQAFYFAAEAKAILAVRPELRTADPRGLGEFVACGCVLENRTIFKDLHVLPPASAWVFRSGRIEKKRTYFHPSEWECQSPLDSKSFYREVCSCFTRKLPRYFDGPERIGVALTGGLDTRAIMAWWKPAANSLPCYTFGGNMRDSQDVVIARHVAALCRQPHQVIRVGNEFLSRFPHYAERTAYLTEGCLNVSNSPDLFISERAREIAPVKVVGTYGSEILCHAVMFKPVDPAPGLFSHEFLSYVQGSRETYARIRSEHPVTFAAFRQSPWQHYGVLSLEQTQLSVRSPYLDNDFVRTAYCAPQTSNGIGDDLRLQLICEGNPALGRIPTDRGITGHSSRLTTAARRSFLDFTSKAEYAYDYGMPQWVAGIDHLFSPLHLERLFLGRHKLAHFRLWYRDPLARYVREMLLDPLTLSRPYIEPKGLTQIVNRHLKGDRNYTTDIHKVLTLELLHRLFF